MKKHLFPLLTAIVSTALPAVSAGHTVAANFYINAAGPLGDGSGSSAANAADATPGKSNGLVHPTGVLGNINVENHHVGMTQSPYKFQGPSGPCGVNVATFEAGNSTVGNVTVRGNTFTAPLPRMTAPVAG